MVRLHVPDGATALPVLLGDLTKAGIDAIGVDVNRPTLDDVFLTLTGRSLTFGLGGTAEDDHVLLGVHSRYVDYLSGARWCCRSASRSGW